MHTVDLEEAQLRLSELIDKATGGEQVIIRKDDRTTVQLVPRPNSPRKRQFGSAKGEISISADFDEPLEEFAEYHRPDHGLKPRGRVYGCGTLLKQAVVLPIEPSSAGFRAAQRLPRGFCPRWCPFGITHSHHV